MQLHCIDQQEAYRLARLRMKDLCLDVDDVGQSQFAEEWRYQLVARMLLRAEAQDPEARLFDDAAELRRECTPNEIVWFIDQHTKLQEAEMAAWSDELKPNV